MSAGDWNNPTATSNGFAIKKTYKLRIVQNTGKYLAKTEITMQAAISSKIQQKLIAQNRKPHMAMNAIDKKAATYQRCASYA